jgi:tripartite-type tricarboxylate transporter receptor subunit TctC
MFIPRRRFLHLAAGAAALSAMSGTARTETYPTRPVRAIVPLAPGGAADISARLMGQWLAERLGQPFIIENRTGAGGNIGTEAVVTAPADGYTLLVAGSFNAINATLYDKLNFNFIRDIAPVAGIMRNPLIMEVTPSFPTKSVGEFIAYAKANPGKVSWASPGVGTVPHLAGELFKHMTGIEMTHVPYRGMTDGLMTDLMTGRVDLMFNTTGSLLQPVKSKQLRGLAVTTAKRFPGAPELPTVMESGVSGYDVSSWYALYAPAKTPADIIKKINADMVAILADPAIKQKFEPLGVLAQSSTPEELATKNAGDAKLWGPIIEEAHIKVE